MKGSALVMEFPDRMTTIKGEIETLENAEPPKDYTMETILEWLDSIKKAPDQRVMELLIRKITVSRENNKTDFKIESNLKSVCVEMVAGERFALSIRISLPILLEYKAAAVYAFQLSR